MLKLINFLLFLICIVTFNVMVVSLVFGFILIFFFNLFIFCFCYYSMGMDVNVKKKDAKQIHLTYFNGDKDVEDDDEFGYFGRNNFSIN